VADPSLRTPFSTGPWRRRVRWAVRIFTPWGVEWLLWKRSREKERERVLAAQIPEAARTSNSFQLEEAIGFLVDRGLDAVQVREGSIPATSLHYLAEAVMDRLPSGRPLRALHVGNFVGVSLSYITWLVTERHPQSLVVSIDPNIPHREVEDPQSHTFALLDHFKMLSRNLIINGYTLERSDEPLTEEPFAAAAACENVLSSLRALAGASFDLILIDGNHEEKYLSKEIAEIRRLLARKGILVLDDVVDWPGVAAVFERVAADDSFVKLGDDGRVGVLQLGS
jgi:SAM-dependent methyltransferase